MKFPEINHISEMLPFIVSNPQFRVQGQPNGTTVICYMLQDEDTFRGEHDFWYKECRGITFHQDGTVAGRTLHKFQNVGENDATQPDQIPWDQISRIMDKRDGSMITPVLMPNGDIICKTKKTFTSLEAQAATEFLHQDQARVDWVRRIMTDGFTPTFEWTSPRFPIVLAYDKDELTLLQIRHNVKGTYVSSLGAGGSYTKDCPFPVIENLLNTKFENGFDPRRLLDLALTTEGVEGWIIQTSEGDLWKVKTKWYCDLHHSVTFTRWRDVAKTVLDDKSDDLKAAFAMTGRSIEPIEKVEHEIHTTIMNRKCHVEEHVGHGKGLGMDAKAMATVHKNDPDFGLIMTMFRGKEVNWYDWYRKSFVKQWSLEVIASVGEDFEIPDVKDEE